MKIGMRCLATLTASAAIVMAVEAETYTLTAAGNGNEAAWTDAQYWQDSRGQTGTPGAALDPSGVYKVKQAYYHLKVPAGAAPFTGGSVMIDAANAFLDMYAAEVTVLGGCDLGQGYAQPMASGVLNADIRAGHWNKQAFFTGPNGSGYSLTVNGNLTADDCSPNNPDYYYRAWFVVQPYDNGQLLYFNLNGDITDANIRFRGRANVSDDGATKSGLIVTMGSTSDIKTLEIVHSTRLKAKTAADVINCGKLLLNEVHEFAYWPKVDVKSGTASRLVVKDAFAEADMVPDRKIKVYVTGDDVYTSAGQSEFPLITMPTDTMPDASVFELTHDPAWTTECAFAIADNGDGTSSVVLRFSPTINIIAKDATSVDTVADLDLSAFTAVRYVAKADGVAGTSSRLSATDSFKRGSSPLAIHLDGDPIDYSPAQEPRRYELLVVPSDAELSVEDVAFTCEAKWAVGVTTGVGASQLEPGRTCFYATFAPMVKLLTSDTGGHNQSTGTTALKTDDPAAPSPWSDGLWPHEDADYLVIGPDMTLRTWTQYRLAGWTFPGRSLTLANGARFVNLISDDLGKAGIVANYRLVGGILENGKNTRAHFSGTFEAVAGTTSRIECGHTNRIFLEDGSLTGSGDLVFAGSKEQYTWTGGIAIFALDASAYAGKVKVMLDTVGFGDPSDDNHVTMQVGGSFGAALSAFAADGVDLGEYATVGATSPLTVAPDSNRGVTVHDVVRFAPTAANPIVIETPVVNNGTIRLISEEGTLSLAGAMTSAANASVSVEGGTLRLAGADAVKGSKLSFAAGAKLEIALDPANAALCATGIDLSALDEPIELDASFGGKLPLTVVNVGAKENFTAAILTCSAVAADAVRAMLPTTVSLKGFVPAAVQERTDPTTGAVTFFVELVRPGKLILIK